MEGFCAEGGDPSAMIRSLVLHEPQGWEQCNNLSFTLQWRCGWFQVMVLATAPPGHQQGSLLMKDLFFNMLGDVLITNSLSNI